MTKIIEWTDHLHRKTFIHVEIDDIDMVRADFTMFDRRLFDDVLNGPPSHTPLADRLLALETMMRRIEEAKAGISSV